MSSSITTTELLFKKFLGTADGKPGTNYAAEAAGSSRPKVIATQVMNQTIPTVAPTDLSTDGTFVATKGSGTKKKSSTYPHIVKYENLVLQDSITPYTTYRYDNPTAAAGNLNLLVNAIPFNFDAATSSYAVTMKSSVGSVSIPPNDATYPWVFDADAGYVYFTTNQFPSGFGYPVLTFWRYEGTFGVGGGSNFTTDASFSGNIYVAGSIFGPGVSLGSFNVTGVLPSSFTYDSDNFSLAVPNAQQQNLQFYSSDLSVNGNLTVGKNMTLGSDALMSGNLTVNKTLTAANGFVVSGGTVSFPSNSISANAISGGLPYVDMTIDQSIAGVKTFTNTLVASGDVSMNGRMFLARDASMSGNLTVNNTLTAANGFVVSGGTVTFPSNSISAAAISGGLPYVDLTTAQSVAGVKTFTSTLVAGGDASMNGRIFTTGDASFGGNLFTTGDISMNGTLRVGKDVTINGNLNVRNYTQSNIINTSVTSYSLIVSEDLSLNGRFYASGDVSMNGNVSLGKISFTPILSVAVGEGTNTIATSYDGVNWTGRGNSIFSGAYGIAWNGSRWVATGTGTTNTIATSTNGIDWTGLGKSVITTHATAVAWNGSMWVAVGTGTNSIATSTDGINWVGQGNSIISDGTGVAGNGSIWVATSNAPNSISTSTNGINWTGRGASIFSTTARAVAWNGSMWVAVGSGTNAIATSTDGINWTGQGTANITEGMDVAWNGSMWAIISGSSTILTSTNGTSWTTRTGPFTFGKGIAWYGSRWIILGQDATNSIGTSTDGITWTGLGKSVITGNGFRAAGAIIGSGTESSVSVIGRLNVTNDIFLNNRLFVTGTIVCNSVVTQF